MRKNVSVMLVVLTVGLGGCAFGNRHVAMKYAPEVQDDGQRSSTAQEIVILPFEDSRPFEHVGNVKNGFGMKTAKVKADGDVKEWVVSAISVELVEDGYTVLDQEEPGVLTMSGNITNVYCTAYGDYRGEIGLFVAVLLDGREIYSRKYDNEVQGGMNWGASSKSFHKILNAVLAETVTEIVWDLNSELRRVGD